MLSGSIRLLGLILFGAITSMKVLCQEPLSLPALYLSINESSLIDLSRYQPEGRNMTFQIANPLDHPRTYIWDVFSRKSNVTLPVNFTSGTRKIVNVAWNRGFNQNLRDEVGILDDNKTIWVGDTIMFSELPRFDQGYQFETDPDMRCFDLVRITRGYWVVDCQNVKTLENAFYIVGFSPYPIHTKVGNLHLGTVNSGIRKLEAVKDGWHLYIVRYYVASSIADEKEALNTYIEVFNFDNMYGHFLVNVIDKTVLNKTTLSTQSVKSYMSRLYILDKSDGVISTLSLNRPTGDYFTYSYQGDKGMLDLALLPEEEYGDYQFIVLVANQRNMSEIDWTISVSPFERISYQLDHLQEIKSLDLGRDYIIVQAVKDQKRLVYIYKRNTQLLSNCYFIADWSGIEPVEIFFNATSQEIISFRPNELDLFRIAKKNLDIYGWPKPNATAIEIDVYFDGKKNMSMRLPIEVTSLEDGLIHSVNRSVDPAYISYPGTGSGKLMSNYEGPTLYFKNHDAKQRTEINKVQETKVQFTLHSPKKMTFELGEQRFRYMEFSTGPKGSLYENYMIAFMQFISNNEVFFFYCFEMNSTFLDCNQIGGFMPTGQVTDILLSQQYVAVKTDATPENIVFYDYSMNFKRLISLSGALDHCSDLDLVSVPGYEFLYCTQALYDRIAIWNLRRLFPDDPNSDPHYVIDKDELGLQDYFKPTEVYISQRYLNMLIVKDIERILFINVAYLDLGTAYIVGGIYSSDSQLIDKENPDNWRITASQFNLLIMNEVQQRIEEWDISDLFMKKKIKEYPLFNGRYRFSFYSDDSFYTFSPNTPYVYLQGEFNHTKAFGSGKNCILVFKVNEQGAASLFHVIETNDTYSTTFIRSVATNNDYDMVLYRGESRSRFFRVYADPYFTFTTTPAADKQASFQELSMEVTNPMIAIALLQRYNVSVWNSGNLIQKTNGPPVMWVEQVDKKARTIEFDEQDAFSGATLQWSIDGCANDECGPKGDFIKIRPRVEKTQNYLKLTSGDVQDMHYANGLLYTIIQNRLMIFNANNLENMTNFLQLLPDWISRFMPCRRFLASDNFGVALCFWDDFSLGAVIVVSFLSSRPAVVYRNIVGIRDFVDAKLYDNYLWILQSDLKPRTRPESRIYVYEFFLENEPNKDIMELAETISGSDFGEENMAITDFDVGRYDNITKQYILMALDTTQRRIVFSRFFKNGEYLNYFIWTDTIDDLFLPQIGNGESIKTAAIRIANIFVPDNDIVRVRFLVASENFHTYFIELALNGSQPDVNPTRKVLRVFQKLGDYLHADTLKTTKEQFVIAVTTNDSVTLTAKLLMYDLLEQADNTTANFYRQPTASIPIPISLTDRQPLPFEIATVDPQNAVHKIWVATRDLQDKVAEYRLWNKMAIIIKNGSLSSQYYRLTVSNEYSSAQSWGRIIINRPPSGGISFIWILLIIIVVVGAIGGGGYYAYKNGYLEKVRTMAASISSRSSVKKEDALLVNP